MLRHMLAISCMAVVLLGFVVPGNAQVGGQIGFVGSFTYDSNTSPTKIASFSGVTVASTPAPTGSFTGLGGQPVTFTPFSFAAGAVTPLWTITVGSNTYYLDAIITSANLTELPYATSFTGNGTVYWNDNGTLYAGAANWSLATNSNNGFNLLISMTTGPQGGNPPGPTFGSQIFSYGAASTNTPPGACAITANVSAGQRIVVLAMEDGNDWHVSGVTDSKGNSYSQMIYYANTNYSASNQSIWSAYVTTPLVAGTDTITITWSSSPSGSWRGYAISIVTLNNTQQAGQPDSTAENNAYGYSNTVSIPGTTVAASTIAVGFLTANYFVWTIGSGTIYESLTENVYYDFFYHVNSSAGAFNPGGTGCQSQTYSGVWAAFK